MQKKVEGQRKNKMINVRQIEAPAGETEKSEVSINPIIENKSSDVALWGESSIQGGNAGLSGYGSGEKGTGSGFGSLESGGAGKDGFGTGYGHGYGHGAGHGGINIADYAYLRDIIMKNITYPEKARRMGWEGRVILSFVVSETGLVNEVKILKSSGYHVLDEAAKEALFKINGFKKKHERLVVQLPIEFRLR
ncbi:MAG TPA: energy transducer TonB [Syntrophorhabdaceae bacterium]|nr:energy transducer TonB [Syntrophorhabdaceae bacterium]